jgi:MFS transporter, CP family, cyanate transporter
MINIKQRRPFWTAMSLLWLSGVGLRVTVLAVPPVIALMQAELGLSGTAVGMLSGLSIVLFGVAAVPGSLLIARFGALPTLIGGLLVAAAASALRGAIANLVVLYAATIAMSAGISVMHPALSLLVRDWVPQRVSLAAAVLTNGLLVGETIPVMLTIPLVLPLVNNSWRAALVVWSLPLVLIALLAIFLAPRENGSNAAAPALDQRWWPDWRDKRVWQLGILFGSVNSVYIANNTFLPGYLIDSGRADLISITLTALNFGQLPASFALLAVSGRIERRASPFMVCGVLMLACLIGIANTASAWTVLYAGCLGFLGAVVFTLGFALPPLLSAPVDVARVSAAMFTISYSECLLVSVLSGAAWDLGGNPRFAFIPIAISALPLLLVPATVRFHRATSAHA